MSSKVYRHKDIKGCILVKSNQIQESHPNSHFQLWVAVLQNVMVRGGLKIPADTLFSGWKRLFRSFISILKRRDGGKKNLSLSKLPKNPYLGLFVIQHVLSGSRTATGGREKDQQ